MPRPRRHQQPPDAAQPPIDTRSKSERQLDHLQWQVTELRRLLVELMLHHGLERAGSRGGPVLLGKEKKIKLSEAVPLVWSKSAAKSQESLHSHTEILKLWATLGMNGVVLETTVTGKTWYTSREAVSRFNEQAFGRRPDTRA